MKKFILCLFIFSIPVLLAGVSLELLIRRIPNDYVVKRKMLEKHHQTAEILVMGSSHSFYGINPEFFSSHCINAAYVSQSLNVDLRILEKYFSEDSNLKFVILPISYFTFFRTIEEGPEQWRTIGYSIYQKIHVSPRFRNLFELLGNTSKSVSKKLLAYYKKKKNPITSSPKGWGMDFLSGESADLSISGPHSAAIHTTTDRTLLIKNKATLFEIQQFLQERNITLILFTPPAYETYTQNLDPNQLELSISIPQELARACENTYYINLLTDDSFEDVHFYDADHLNEIGAKKLTQLLQAKIKDYELY